MGNKEYWTQYWSNNRDKILRHQKEYRAKHREEMIKRYANYRAKNKGKIKDYHDNHKSDLKRNYYNRVHRLEFLII